MIYRATHRLCDRPGRGRHRLTGGVGRAVTGTVERSLAAEVMMG